MSGAASQRPARVLYLAGGPDGANVYGAERCLVDLVTLLDRSRFVPCGAVPQGEGPFVDALRAAEVPVPALRLGGGRRLGAGALPAFARKARRLAEVARESRPDLIHVNALGLNRYGVLLGRLLQIPVLCHLHAIYSARAQVTNLAFCSDTVVAVSEAAAQPCRRVVRHPARVRVVHNGIRTAQYRVDALGRARSRAGLGLGDDVFVIGVVGRFSPEKNLETFFGALRLLVQGGRRVVAVLAGDAHPSRREYGAYLRALPAQMGIGEQVIFREYVTDTSSLYAPLDAYVLAGGRESFGLAVVEAMAASRPVVAARAGGPLEIIADGETGLLVRPEDPAALAGALARLADDPALGRRLGEAGARRVQERFCAEHCVHALEEVYAEMLRRWERHP